MYQGYFEYIWMMLLVIDSFVLGHIQNIRRDAKQK